MGPRYQRYVTQAELVVEAKAPKIAILPLFGFVALRYLHDLQSEQYLPSLSRSVTQVSGALCRGAPLAGMTIQAHPGTRHRRSHRADALAGPAHPGNRVTSASRASSAVVAVRSKCVVKKPSHRKRPTPRMSAFDREGSNE